MSIAKLKTKFADGAWIKNVKEFFSKINEIIDYLNGSNGLGYQVYRANLTQTGTDAPEVTILSNTLGANIVWTRDGSGAYFGTLAGKFLEDKTFVLHNTPSGNNRTVNVFRGDDNYIEINTFDNAGLLDDGLLAVESIEIIVYP